MAETFDVVIVGGAAMGSSTAYHLAADPDFSGRVLVIEKDLTYARAASALSLSSIRRQFSSPVNILISEAGLAFLRKAPDLLSVDGEAPDLPLAERGYLYLASAAGVGVLKENNAVQRAYGADVALIDPEALKARFPWIATDGVALASLGLSGEGWFDGYALTQAFRQKARQLGVVYREDEVVGFSHSGARVSEARLKSGERIACGAVVIAAGASGATRLARALGVDIPVRSRKRCVFVFEAKARLERCPLVIDVSGVYFRPEGELFVTGVSPPEARDPDSDDFEVDWALFDDTIWPALAERVPAFEALKVKRAWAGHYDLNLFDHNAIVGRLGAFENVLIAAGFSGHGMQQSPAVGRGLAELIARGRYETLDLKDLSFERIAARRPLLERNVI